VRDLYNKDIDEILVSGEDGYREAKDFMRMLMPSHAKNVQPNKDTQPLFARNGIEAQLDAMFSPQVTLRSGGYLVINPTEALVSIDVNSGRSTREHNIEDTALQTNLEAAEEVSRQLRLRDLAGLVVIDFIDMEEKRNNRAVERKLNDALKNDRARIQVGRISHFGLLEMSRQRIRTGVLESTTTVCPTCQGTGHVRSPSSVALHVLRSLEDTLLKGATHNLTIRTRTPVALYILNQKRAHLSEIEQRFGLIITVMADELIQNGSHFAIERGEPVERREIQPTSIQPDSVQPAFAAEGEPEEAAVEVAEEEEYAADVETESSDERQQSRMRDGEEGGGRRRRRRRRRGGRGGDRPEERTTAQGAAPEGAESGSAEPEDAEPGQPESGEGYGASSENGDDSPRRRRRGRRGGRRGRRGRGGEERANGGNGREPDQPQPGVMAIVDFSNEIDTDPALSYEPYQRSEPAEREVDTTPQSESQAAPDEPETVDRESERRDAESASAAPQPEEPAGPKKSGWWQRRTFF
jgi:ribonuclease E